LITHYFSPATLELTLIQQHNFIFVSCPSASIYALTDVHTKGLYAQQAAYCNKINRKCQLQDQIWLFFNLI